MPMTFRLLNKTILAAGTTSVTLSSIPQTYTHLYLMVNFKVNSTSGDGFGWQSMRFNADANARYNFKRLGTAGGNPWSDGNVNNNVNTRIMFPTVPGNMGTSNALCNGFAYILNYTSSQPKVAHIEASAPNNASSPNYHTVVGATYDSTSAISSIEIASPVGENILAGATFHLYGLLRA